MRVSTYTIYVPEYPAPDELLVHNTLSDSTVVINQALKAVLDQLPSMEGVDEEIQEQLDTLEDLGILVADGVDEHGLVEERFYRERVDASTLDIILMTTYACNFGCVYCVEEGIKGDVHMDPETCDRAVAWMIRRAEDMDHEKIRLCFSGGEPLLNVPAMERISRGLHAWTREHGGTFESTLNTNGALLTPEVVEQLVPYGLRGVKVTLDGDREAHDAKRPFRNGAGSFDRIIANIRAVGGRIPIQIGGNFDEENVEHIPALLDYLAAEGLAPYLSIVDFKPIVPSLGPSGQEAACTFPGGDLLREMEPIRRAAIQRGFRVRTGLAAGICAATGEHLMAIGARGELYKCPAFVGRSGFEVGHLTEPNFNDRYGAFMGREAWRSCMDCPYVPVCGGGCLYNAYVQYGSLDRLDCHRTFFETMGPEILKTDYEFGLISDE